MSKATAIKKVETVTSSLKMLRGKLTESEKEVTPKKADLLEREQAPTTLAITKATRWTVDR